MGTYLAEAGKEESVTSVGFDDWKDLGVKGWVLAGFAPVDEAVGEDCTEKG